MPDPYYLDLETFGLEKFRHVLETTEMMPGRVVLQEDIPERFARLEAMGITNLQELISALSTPKKRELFSQESGLPLDYLVILRRQAKSYLPKPVYFREVPGLLPEYVEKLAAVGISHSKHLFERAQTKAARSELSRLVDVPEEALLELVGMADLSRVLGVGPAFVRLFYEAGVDNLESLARWSPEALFERLHAVNREKRYTKVVPSLKDVRHSVKYAQNLPKIVEYD
jgi:predicted flap endonuclease-1-like 5' DNA nuclease